MPAQDCAPILKALSDGTRWKIVQKLLLVPRANVSTLTEELGVSQPNISKHLRILREAGLVTSRKEGTVVWCEIQPEWRRKLHDGEAMLELGCCSFRFPAEQEDSAKQVRAPAGAA